MPIILLIAVHICFKGIKYMLNFCAFLMTAIHCCSSEKALHLTKTLSQKMSDSIHLPFNIVPLSLFNMKEFLPPLSS